MRGVEEYRSTPRARRRNGHGRCRDRKAARPREARTARPRHRGESRHTDTRDRERRAKKARRDKGLSSRIARILRPSRSQAIGDLELRQPPRLACPSDGRDLPCGRPSCRQETAYAARQSRMSSRFRGAAPLSDSAQDGRRTSLLFPVLGPFADEELHVVLGLERSRSRLPHVLRLD